jgi:hypothetical protein
MKKSRLLGAACAIAFVSTSANAAEVVMHNAGESGSQGALFHSMAVGVNQPEGNRTNQLSSGLLDTVFIISCGAIGLLMLRKANNS